MGLMTFKHQWRQHLILLMWSWIECTGSHEAGGQTALPIEILLHALCADWIPPAYGYAHVAMQNSCAESAWSILTSLQHAAPPSGCLESLIESAFQDHPATPSR